jgi:hypothetical protein
MFLPRRDFFGPAHFPTAHAVGYDVPSIPEFEQQAIGTKSMVRPRG